MIKNILKKSLLVIALIVPLFIWYDFNKFLEEGETIHIAMVGPLSGSGAIKGKSVLKGINLLLDNINEKGGINGKKISLSIFDDQNDKVIAKQKAQEIVDQKRIIGVIGHWYSSCSINAGEIYEKNSIPAITPGATNIKVTDNEWYFRTVFNDKSQGRFLANYASKVLNQKNVCIISEDLPYGSYLASIFKETAKEIGMNVVFNRQFQTSDQNIDDSLKKIVHDLKKTKNRKSSWQNCAIFMATHATEGIKLVKMMKDEGFKNPIIVPDSLASKQFSMGFNEFPEEKAYPGYYTDGIYATSPLIFDTANEKAQLFKEKFTKKFNEEPDWIAAFGYDTAMVLLEAIKNSNVEARPETLNSDRFKVKNYLKSMTDQNNALEGVTGFNYFDEKGDCPKPISIGVYKFQNSISALTQLKTVPNLNEVTNLEASLADKKILFVDNKYMYKTNVVYTGIEIKEISDINMHDLTCTINFFLWFRYKGDFKPENIVFHNSYDPIRLRKPIIKKKINGIQYKAYKLKSKFKADFLPGSFAFRQHVIGISFYHREMTRNNLIYVIDFLGMGLSGGKSLIKKFQNAQSFNQSSDWAMNNAWFFQDIFEKTALGSPEHLDPDGGTLKYSRFNLGIKIVKSSLSLRGTIPRQYVNQIMIISIVLFFVFIFAAKKGIFKPIDKYLIFIFTFFALVGTLSSEIVLFDWLANKTTNNNLKLIIRIFDILWWIIPAFLLNIAADRFLWIPLEEKTGRTIPKNAKRFLATVIYVLAIFGIVAFVFNQKLTSLLATSGMFAMIVGLAIQVNISNVFAGIAINLDRPFRTGDWVIIGNFEEGIVVDITWRATRVRTRNGCILSIPNSEASESAIHNFSYPDDKYWQYFTIHVDPVHDPERVKKILVDAAMAVESVLHDPPPTSRYLGLNEDMTKQSKFWASNFLISVCVKDYGSKFIHNEAVWTSVMKHLKNAGIEPITKRADIKILDAEKACLIKKTDTNGILKKIDLFAPFIHEIEPYLDSLMTKKYYKAGESIFKANDPSSFFIIIAEGVVSLRETEENNKYNEIKRLTIGNYAGELSFFTGIKHEYSCIAVSDTFVFQISKNDLLPLFQDRPEIIKHICNTITNDYIKNQSNKGESYSDIVNNQKIIDDFYLRISNQFKE